MPGRYAAPSGSKPLIVSIRQARALLDASAASLSDDEVREVILELQALAAAATASYAVQKNKKPLYIQERHEPK